MTLLRRIPDGKPLRQPGERGIAAQLPESETVERRGAEIAGRGERERCGNTRSHFIRGFPGESQRQDAPAVDAVADQVDEAPGQRRRLPRTGTGKDELDFGRAGCGLLLNGVERQLHMTSIALDGLAAWATATCDFARAGAPGNAVAYPTEIAQAIL